MRSIKYWSITLFLSLIATAISAQNERALISLYVNGIYRSEINALIQEESSILLPTTDVLQALKPLLDKQYYDILVNLNTEFISLKDIQFLGITAEFNKSILQLNLNVPYQYLPEKYLNGERTTKINTNLTISPEPFSAYLNTTTAIGFKKEPQLSPFFIGSISLNGVVNFHRWVIDTEGSLKYNVQPNLELKKLQLVHDFRTLGLRFMTGTIDLPQTGNQSRISTIGMSISSYPESLLISNPVTAIEKKRTLYINSSDFIVVNHPAKITIKTNGITVRNVNVDPGKYKIGELPFASGINNVVVQIEEVGQDPIEYRMLIPFEEGLLTQKDYRFALGMGLDSLDINRFSTSGYFRYGLTDAIELGTNLQIGFGVLLGGISLKTATILGYFYGDSAVSLTYNEPVYQPGYSGTLSYRLNLPSYPYIPHVGFSYQYNTPQFFTSLSSRDSIASDPSWKFSMQLTQSTTIGLSFALTGDVGSSSGRNYVSTALGFSIPVRKGTTLSSSFSMDNHLGYFIPQGSISLLVIPQNGTTISHYHQSITDGESGFEVSMDNDENNKKYNGSISVSNPIFPSLNPFSLNATIKRTGEISTITSNIWYLNNQNGTESSYGSTINFEGALVYADGIIAFSHPIFDSFVIVYPEKSLSTEVVQMSTGATSQIVSKDGRPVTLPNLTSYKSVDARIELPEAPADTTITTPFITLKPEYKSGIVVKPSIKKSSIVSGTIIDSGGKPLSWVLGRLQNLQNLEETAIFTDENGYFQAYITDIGTYRLIWDTNELSPIDFTITEQSDSTVSLGVIQINSGGKTSNE